MQLDVLADQADSHAARAVLMRPSISVHSRRSGAGASIPGSRQTMLENHSFQHDGRLVQHRQREVLDHAIRLYIAEKRDLAADFLIHRLVAAHDDDIRGNPH